MRYSEIPQRTGEVLRLVLPRIAQHGGSYDPTAYCVWYEHLAGVNPALSQALAPRLQQPARLEQAELEQLYAQHIQQRNEHSTNKLQAELGELIRKLTTLAATSGDEAAEYAKTLANS
jgi:diguanylate cyclase